MMGGGDRCAVVGCNNDRRYPERYIIKEHVQTLRFHCCRDKKYFPLWTRLLQRQDFEVKASTRVCSNHFKYGQPFPVDPHPTLFLKGYSDNVAQGRSRKRLALDESIPQPNKKTRTPKPTGDQANPEENAITGLEHDHSYAQDPSRRSVFSSECVEDKLEKLGNQHGQCNDLGNKFHEGTSKLELGAQEKMEHLSTDDIRHSTELIKLYTGLPSCAIFQWFFEEIKPHAMNAHCYQAKVPSVEDQANQMKDQEESRPERLLVLEDEFLMTLMKVRLDLNVSDLAFLFGVSQNTVSQVITTWAPFLDKELKSFIQWPS